MEGPGQDRIERLFNSISADYDRLNHLLSLNVDKTWRRRALKEILPPAAGGSGTSGAQVSYEVLDVACGTGDFSLEIARRSVSIDRPCRITGLDLSEGMLAVMRDKVARAGFAAAARPDAGESADGTPAGECTDGCVGPGKGVTITALRGNCEAMPFADGAFDCVTIAFGIRNFEHRELALREILRVLKPGGKLVILELSVPSQPVLRGLYKLYFTKILPLVGGWISGDKAAYRYLPASVLQFPPKEQWMDIMRSCGYAGVCHKAYTFGICRQYTGIKPVTPGFSAPGGKPDASFDIP